MRLQKHWILKSLKLFKFLICYVQLLQIINIVKFLIDCLKILVSKVKFITKNKDLYDTRNSSKE